VLKPWPLIPGWQRRSGRVDQYRSEEGDRIGDSGLYSRLVEEEEEDRQCGAMTTGF
jgi:hypothetical protein